MISETLSAQDIASYFLFKVDLKSGDDITPLKLQKLLYYAQGLHIATSGGEPVFSESLYAWTHGPAVKSIYQRYKGCGHWPIDPPTKIEIGKYPPEMREILNAVYANYGQFSAKKLEDMTHDERPWKETPRGRVIQRTLLREFFAEVAEAGKVGVAVANNPVWPANSFRFQGRKASSARMQPHREKLRAIRERFSIDMQK